MIKKIAPLAILGAAHIRLDPAEGTATRDGLDERAERLRVDRVAEGEQGGEEGEFGGGEAGEVG